MSINIVAFIFGCILILIGIIGGGFELKELKIPKVGSFTRVIAILGGSFFTIKVAPKLDYNVFAFNGQHC